MKVLVILPFLVILSQFYGVLCDVQKAVDRDGKINERTKRYHEDDCQKRTLIEKKPNKAATPTGSKNVEAKAKTVPKSVNKAKLPINERNEPKDVRTLNHILNEIATMAHNHNQSKGINKIRHLVDEIDNLNKIKNTVKSNDKNSTKEVSLSETKNPSQEHESIIKLDPVKNTTNRLHTGNVSQPLLTNGRRFNIEIPFEQVAEANTTGNKIKDDNIIEIEEHKYEEELTQSPYKSNMLNCNSWQNYNTGSIPYGYNGNGNNVENYSSNLNNYPLATYEPYNVNNGYNYANWINPSNQRINEHNRDNTRFRKTWTDRNTILSTGTPNELGRINEDRKELTSIQNPEFYRNYYSVTQKQYSGNNEAKSNHYANYVNPYQCSKWGM